MNTKQNRFTETCETDRRPRKKEDQKFYGSFGYKSSSPGPWVTGVMVDALRSDRDDEPLTSKAADLYQLRSTHAILDAFRLRSRYRRPLIPLAGKGWLDGSDNGIPATAFIPEEETLDNRSLHFGTAERHPVDTTANFPMVGQPNVLAGPEWLAWQRNHQLSLHSYQTMLDESKETKKRTAKAKDKVRGKEKPGAKERIRISDQQLKEDYEAWFDNPHSDNTHPFFVTLHHFLSGKSRLVGNNEDVKMREQLDDFQQDFALGMMATLREQKQQGDRLEKPAHYITKSWTNGRIDKNEHISKEDKKFPSTQNGRDTDDPDEDFRTLDLIGKRDHEDWAHGSNDIEAQIDEDALRRRRFQLLSSLNADLRDVVGMHLAGQTQTEIATVLRVSQKAISKKLAQVRQEVGAMTGEVLCE